MALSPQSFWTLNAFSSSSQRLSNRGVWAVKQTLLIYIYIYIYGYVLCEGLWHRWPLGAEGVRTDAHTTPHKHTLWFLLWPNSSFRLRPLSEPLLPESMGSPSPGIAQRLWPLTRCYGQPASSWGESRGTGKGQGRKLRRGFIREERKRWDVKWVGGGCVT